MFLYDDVLKKRGLSKLIKKISNCNNIRDIKYYLDSIEVVENTKISLIKELFDNNLQGEYKELIPSGGMCGYWALVYKALFDSLGYETKLLEIRSKNKRFHHVICRIHLYSNIIDISRSIISIGNNETTDYLEHWINRVVKKHGSCRVLTIEDIDGLYDKFTLYSAVSIEKEVYNEMQRYTNYISTGDFSKYIPTDLKELCKDGLRYKVILGCASLDERVKLANRLYKEHKPIRD